MTTDQITPEQKAASPFFPGFWDNRGWGFGLSVITRRDDVAGVPGRFGWDGGYGTSGLCGPQGGHGRHPDDPAPLGFAQAARRPRRFLDLAYQAIDD